MGVLVASSSTGVSGSSEGSVGKLPPVRMAWLDTCVTPAGSGLSIVTRKETWAELSPPGMVPRSTPTVVLPALLPLVTVPWLTVTEPTTSVVLVGVSVRKALVAFWLPELMISMVYSSVSPGEGVPLLSASIASRSRL